MRMKSAVIDTAKEVLTTEANAIRGLLKYIDKSFEKAVEMMRGCEGRVIITGMGKPGFIGRKIAATLASTGTPSMFLHPAEAVHGDLGMVTEKDIMIAISQSGETEEIVRLISPLKKIGVKVIAMTSAPQSTLARHAAVVLNLGVNREACPLNLAPSTSTTASLAMGDALALSLHKKKGFRSEDFALFHPGGSLGRKLLRVREIMRTGKDNPIVLESTPVHEVLLKITSARAGSCTLVNKKGAVVGIFTDGDLRRHLRKDNQQIMLCPVIQYGTRNPTVIEQDKLAAEALNILKTKKIDELPVVDSKGKAVGLLDVQDLLKAGFV